MGKQYCRSLLIAMALLASAAVRAVAAPDLYDRFYDDDTSATLNRFQVNFPQDHVIDGLADEDWATFDAQAGLPYGIYVKNVGDGLDPVLEVFPNGPDQPSFKRDFNGFGGGETYLSANWPVTGRCWVRVTAAGVRLGSTSYTLSIALETGANVGLASIGGLGYAPAGPGAGEVQLAQSLYQNDGTKVTPLYTLSKATWPAGTFPTSGEPAVSIGSLGDSRTTLRSPWLVKWHQDHESNFTLTRLTAYPPDQLGHPIDLTIQMRGQPVTMDVDDGSVIWQQTHFQDLPAGVNLHDFGAIVYLWNGATNLWEPYDEHPFIEADGDNWFATTSVLSVLQNSAYSALFAVALTPRTYSAAAEWQLYP